eukprot:TRINITY_DN17380_c0_g1_i1.p1 TRINITY_DN17380_c0_g1~~TRINITY_DN17380_c0_g1_i1.p1  ORF type:complete len:401 (-),score=146.00 TRINITY_DN17380_c0_g1_i1:14-1048(-)
MPSVLLRSSTASSSPSQRPLSPRGADGKTGWLWLMRPSRRRYDLYHFVVHEHEGELKYYKSPPTSAAEAEDDIGAISLYGCKLEERKLDNGRCVLYLQNSDGEDQEVYANTPTEQAQWKKALSEVVSHLPNKRPAVVYGIFGTPVSAVMPRTTPRGTASEHRVPIILEIPICFLESDLSTEGLFRMSGGSGAIQKLKDAFSTGDEQVSIRAVRDCRDIHAVAGIMKFWLRTLPEPLVPFDSYAPLVKVAEDPIEASRLVSLKALSLTLPEDNRRCLYVLMHFLHNVQSYSEMNKMTPSNLAIVFGLNIFRTPDDNPVTAIADSSNINIITVDFILHPEVLSRSE